MRETINIVGVGAVIEIMQHQKMRKSTSFVFIFAPHDAEMLCGAVPFIIIYVTNIKQSMSKQTIIKVHVHVMSFNFLIMNSISHPTPFS